MITTTLVNGKLHFNCVKQITLFQGISTIIHDVLFLCCYRSH